jgi:hypothetical protein
MYVTIEGLNDNAKHTYFMENGREIDVEILKPLDMAESTTVQDVVQPIPKDIPYLHKRPPKTDPYPSAFSGVGHRAGGSFDPTKSRRDLFLEQYTRR